MFRLLHAELSGGHQNYLMVVDLVQQAGIRHHVQEQQEESDHVAVPTVPVLPDDVEPLGLDGTLVSAVQPVDLLLAQVFVHFDLAQALLVVAFSPERLDSPWVRF